MTAHGEERVTLQPERGVRLAAVVRRTSGPAAGFVLAATVVLASRRPVSPDHGPGLAARLGGAPGQLPGSVLLLLAAFFATDALLMGDPRLAAVAFGSLAALGTVAWRAAT